MNHKLSRFAALSSIVALGALGAPRAGRPARRLPQRES